MKKHKALLGWLALGAAVYWLWFDYQNKIKQAIMAGWATIGLTLAHIFA